MPNSAPTKTLKIDGVNVRIFADKNALGTAAAQDVAKHLRQAVSERGQANIIVATGASQYEFLDALRNTKGVDWPKVTAFHLDEYLGMSADHPASFRRYLQERLFNYVAFGAVHLLQGDAADPEAECRRYASLLAEKIIDVACIGIGENGHLAFNDPPADFQTQQLVHVVSLDERCRRQQIGERHFATIDDVPAKALSLSVPAILRAHFIGCCVPDRRKAEAVHGSLEGPISPDCPGSVLRRHQNCTIYLDTDSASLLKSL